MNKLVQHDYLNNENHNQEKNIFVKLVDNFMKQGNQAF